MLTHLSDGTVRRYLDEPGAVGDTERVHLSGCARCRAALARAEADRDAVAHAFAGVLGPDAGAGAVHSGAEVPAGAGDGAFPGESVAGTGPDPDRAWTALTRRLEDPPESGRQPGWVVPDPTTGRRRPRLVEQAVRRPLAGAVAAGIVLLGGGAAAAATGWLPVFRTEKVAPVQVSPQDLIGVDQLVGQVGDFHELAAFGDVVAPTAALPSPVPDAAAATARTGLSVPRVAERPTGVTGGPSFLVMDRQTVQFTVSAAKMAQAARSRGVTLPPMPAGLDGTRVQLQGGPAVAEVWGYGSAVPSLVVVRAKAPTAATQGASFPAVRDYVLSVPGISPQLAAQLRTVTGDGTTLPIPVPKDLATSSQVDVGGVQATVVESRNRLGVAVIWVDGGALNVVLGPLSKDEVLAVARGLG